MSEQEKAGGTHVEEGIRLTVQAGKIWGVNVPQAGCRSFLHTLALSLEQEIVDGTEKRCRGVAFTGTFKEVRHEEFLYACIQDMHDDT